MMQRLFIQTLCDLEILRRLRWEVDWQILEHGKVSLFFKTFMGSFYFRLDIEAEKDKPYIYRPNYPYPEIIKAQTAQEATAWLLSDVCSFYLLLVLQRALDLILGSNSDLFAVPPYYPKGVDFHLIVDKTAIVAAHIFKKSNYSVSGSIITQVPLSLHPDGFYAAVSFNHGDEMVLDLNDTYPSVVRNLEQVIALSQL
jgi:hypothetical protein